MTNFDLNYVFSPTYALGNFFSYLSACILQTCLTIVLIVSKSILLVIIGLPLNYIENKKCWDDKHFDNSELAISTSDSSLNVVIFTGSLFPGTMFLEPFPSVEAFKNTVNESKQVTFCHTRSPVPSESETVL